MFTVFRSFFPPAEIGTVLLSHWAFMKTWISKLIGTVKSICQIKLRKDVIGHASLDVVLQFEFRRITPLEKTDTYIQTQKHPWNQTENRRQWTCVIGRTFYDSNFAELPPVKNPIPNYRYSDTESPIEIRNQTEFKKDNERRQWELDWMFYMLRTYGSTTYGEMPI